MLVGSQIKPLLCPFKADYAYGSTCNVQCMTLIHLFIHSFNSPWAAPSAACHLEHSPSDSESPSQCNTWSISGYFPASSSCQKPAQELWHRCQGRFYYFTVTSNGDTTFNCLLLRLTRCLTFETIKSFSGAIVWTALRGKCTLSVVCRRRNELKRTATRPGYGREGVFVQ